MEKYLSDYFINYAKCYDDFDYERLTQFYLAPTLMVKNGLVISLATSSDVLNHLKTLLASYREHGYKKDNLEGLDVQTIGH